MRVAAALLIAACGGGGSQQLASGANVQPSAGQSAAPAAAASRMQSAPSAGLSGSASPRGGAGATTASPAGASASAGTPAGGASVSGSAASGSGAARASAGMPAAVGGSAAPAAGTTAAQGGSGPAAARPIPVERAGKYVIERGAFSFEIDPAHGARITRFGLGGMNLLTGPEIDATNYGSTFWPSPQQRWNWPPVPELDAEPYTAQLEGDSLSCTSRPGMRAKVSVVKRVRASASGDGVELEYTLKNEDSAKLSWAPWEITRVAAGGLSFFPSGQSVVSSQLAVVSQSGATWYRHDPAALAGGGQKLTADGAGGFLAHAAGRTLFVKQFMDLTPAQQAPAPEAEIALYAAAGYVELEPQGPYTELTPGQSVSWRVRWLLAPIPDDVPIEVGSSALLQLARDLAAR